MKFTKDNINKLVPRKSRYIIMDDSTPNFGIKVYPSGEKAYIVKVKSVGKTKEYTISKCSLISTASARKKAGDIIEEYQRGIDVKAKEKTLKIKSKTLQQCMEEYLPTIKERTQRNILDCKKIWGSWLKKPIRDITSSMILKLYDKRLKVSQHGARLDAAYLRAIWNYHKKELNLGESPTSILNEERKGWNKKTTKHRRLDHETAAQWYQAINSVSDRDRNMFLLVYYTGLRAGEAMGLEFKMINFSNSSLHIPDTKNGKPLDIPLNSQAINVLNSVKKSEFKHKKYVFPQVDKKGNVSAMKYYSKSLAKIKKQGVMWSCHDSRRGYINAGGVTGCNQYMIKQLVNHTSEESAHDGYNHYTIGELRSATQTIGDYLENQLHSTNVVPFKKEA